MYRRTHHNYDAGEQLHRNYRFPLQITGNEEFRYGIGKKSNPVSASLCLKWE
jgi:hypothetical protein